MNDDVMYRAMDRALKKNQRRKTKEALIGTAIVLPLIPILLFGAIFLFKALGWYD